MAWRDRLTEYVIYTSPNGTVFNFNYDNLSQEIDRKTATFIFPEINGAFVQNLGRAGKRFSLTIFFIGSDCDTQADSFITSLDELGIGKLEISLYGTFDVVPTGQITRNDALTSEANQVVFTVTFSETIPDITFPSSTQSAENDINASLDNFSDTSANEFSGNILTDNNANKINLQVMMGQQSTSINNSMKSLLQYSEDFTASFNEMSTSYENNIDDLFDDVEGIARQGISIIRLPSKIQTNAKEKIQIYSDMFTHLGEDYQRATESFENIFFETNKNLMSCVAGANESILYSDFSNRNEAIEVSESLLDLYDDLLDWQDTEIEDKEIIDIGDGFDTLAKVVGQVAGYLINLSFSLPKEKRIILGSDRNIIELVAEIYGDLNKLDDFIIQNNLNSDQIELLETGEEVVYYE